MELQQLQNCCKDMKLLYVEDNIDTRAFTLEMLERFFNDIVIAVDGEDGLNLFQQYTFDLVITDINMPKKNGITLIKDIKVIDKDVTVIVLSAHNESGYFDEVASLNVQAYINKPMTLNDFLEIMATLCSRKSIDY